MAQTDSLTLVGSASLAQHLVVDDLLSAVGDPARLAALRGLDLLDAPAEATYDRLTRLAAKVVGVPVCLISLVDAGRQFFLSGQGLPEPWSTGRQTALSHSFCKHVVGSRSPLVVTDARLDPRFADNGAVTDLGVVAYLGMPLTTETGHVLGSLCVIDGRAREWTAGERDVLADLAASVMTEIRLRAEITERTRAEAALREANAALERHGAALAAANARLSEVAVTDELTGLKNRRYFMERLESTHALARRGGAPVSLLMVDVDWFKPFNDTFGHPAGDEVLRAFADVLTRGMRASDVVARYGGEEFVVLLPETDAAGAVTAAERLRRAVESRTWPLRPVTASFGAATLTPGSEVPSDLISRADRALYRSKRAGRNRVTHDRIDPFAG